MRLWRSKLYLPQSAINKADRELRQRGGIDHGSTLWPACEVCSKRTGIRFAVESYEVADKGHTLGGDPFTDVRARCHGEESVIRIEGLDWNMKRDQATADPIRVAAIGALTFFATTGDVTIPAKVFASAFIGGR